MWGYKAIFNRSIEDCMLDVFWPVFLSKSTLTHIITLNQWVTSMAHFVLHSLHKQNTEDILFAVIKQTQVAYFINTSWQIWIRADVKPESVFC